MLFSRTLNPLHFEDLDPHRFEDLVRQLTYDFRDWRVLEPTGRLGGDDGYDARGFEIVGDSIQESEKDPDEGADEEGVPIKSPDRLWQIQCKREKTISPKEIGVYIDGMMPEGSDTPHGVIFVAACDFSKKARDVFIKKMRDKKVQEFYLWGKADLEDMLFQPKNDNLLYAYFGFSLAIRRRSLKMQIRSHLAIKRKTVRCLGGIEERGHKEVLVRDVTDTHYPYSGDVANFKKKPKWKIYRFLGHTHEGIKLLVRQYIAYREIDQATGKLIKWDYSEEVNLALKSNDRWNLDKDWTETYRKAHTFLDTIDKDNQAFFEIEGIIPYDNIIDIDDLGDPLASCPHIYVEAKEGIWFSRDDSYLSPRGGYAETIRLRAGDDKKRAKIFPKKLPDIPQYPPLPIMKTKVTDPSKSKGDDINPEFKELTGEDDETV